MRERLVVIGTAIRWSLCHIIASMVFAYTFFGPNSQGMFEMGMNEAKGLTVPVVVFFCFLQVIVQLGTWGNYRGVAGRISFKVLLGIAAPVTVWAFYRTDLVTLLSLLFILSFIAAYVDYSRSMRLARP